MCGIAGAFSPSGQMPWGPEVVDAMCKAITHRGPDDQGIYSHASAHVGMRRLAIIDLHSGHQPIANEDGTVWIVFNGEIYNYLKLRAELQRLGHTFATQTDTECIVHAYEQYGLEAFGRLRGMFALAIVDLRHQRLVLARDRLGKKPLYHTRLADGTIAFGSELKCLLAIPGFRPAVSATATRDFFAMGYVPGPGSIYEGVGKLPPAHVMVAERGETRLHRYWDPSFGPKWTADHHTLQRQLLDHLEDAVRVRLVSDVPFGAFLSGGTDSSVVAALMARNLKQPLKTFSIGFREAAFNELPDARRVAQYLGADHHELVVEADTVALLDKLVWHFDEPFADASAVPTYLVSRLAAGHVKMVLSGDGGDELFAGYERYARYNQLRKWRAMSLGVGGAALSAAGALVPGARGYRLSRIAERLSQSFPDDYLSGVGLARRQELVRILDLPGVDLDPYAHVRAPYLDARGGDELDALLWGDINTYLLEDVLVKVDRMTMANSLEARSPLLDHQLLEFAARLPADLKLRGGQGKWLLKAVARQLLPPEFINKPKQGFAIPLSQWMRGPLLPMLRDVLHARAFRERGVFHVAAVRQCLDEHVSGARDHGELLWMVLNHELWSRRFVDQTPALAPAVV
jgi:asparagine synthase (glutamine-hydrolysing)